MNRRIACKSVAEFNKALENGDVAVVYFPEWVVASGSAHVKASGSAHVKARESAHVEAYESAHVVAYESAHVVAYESAHVEAYESAHVVAYESAHVKASGSAHVVASKFVAVHRHGNTPVVVGGVVIQVDPPKTAEEWCEFYGVEIVDGIAVLFKAVDDKYNSPHGTCYAPGTMPAAKDWDGGKAECGGGLHFSPHPTAAMAFFADARRFVACPVKVSEIVVHPNAKMPEKVKAPRVAGAIWEVNRRGEEIR